MKRTSSARTPSLRPLAASLAIAFAVLATIEADARPQPRSVRPDHVVATPQPVAPRGAIVVTNCDDGGPGSLREAYFNAVDGDTIDLTQLACSTISLTTGIALTNSGATHNVTLIGPGRDELTIDGALTNRVLVHNGEGDLHLIGLSIANGSYSGPYGGGCIYSYGGVHTEGVDISHCSLFSGGAYRAHGGAIYSHGRTYLSDTRITNSTAHSAGSGGAGGAVYAPSVQIIRSTLSGNTAVSGVNHFSLGGGFLSTNDAEVRYSTIADNTADIGGGLVLIDSATPQTRLIINSTISGNHAGYGVGGIYCGYAPSLLRIINSTITANSAAGFEVGAGAYLVSVSEIVSSIVAGNTGPQGPADIAGETETPITGSNNIIIESLVPLPPDTIQADPLLGPLQDNGGLTPTHALLAGSPAIDQGLNLLGLSLDQRAFDEDVPGYEREVGPGTDIGAFEFGAPDRIFTDAFEA
jgi:hypothetical protein